jgi:hypothetical protein
VELTWKIKTGKGNQSLISVSVYAELDLDSLQNDEAGSLLRSHGKLWRDI